MKNCTAVTLQNGTNILGLDWPEISDPSEQNWLAQPNQGDRVVRLLRALRVLRVPCGMFPFHHSTSFIPPSVMSQPAKTQLRLLQASRNTQPAQPQLSRRTHAHIHLTRTTNQTVLYSNRFDYCRHATSTSSFTLCVACPSPCCSM